MPLTLGLKPPHPKNSITFTDPSDQTESGSIGRAAAINLDICTGLMMYPLWERFWTWLFGWHY